MSTWVLVSSLNAPSSGVFDFPSLTLTAYSAIQVVGSGITVTTDGTDITLTVYESGVELTTSQYRFGMHLDASSGSGNTDADNTPSSMFLVSNDLNFDVGNAASEGIGFIATFDSPASSSLRKRMAFESAFTNAAGNCVSAEGVNVQNGTAAIDGLKISGTSSLTAGKVRILGLA